MSNIELEEKRVSMRLKYGVRAVMLVTTSPLTLDVVEGYLRRGFSINDVETLGEAANHGFDLDHIEILSRNFRAHDPTQPELKAAVEVFHRAHDVHLHCNLLETARSAVVEGS